MHINDILRSGLYITCCVCNHCWKEDVKFNLYNFPINQLAKAISELNCPKCGKDGLLRFMGPIEVESFVNDIKEA